MTDICTFDCRKDNCELHNLELKATGQGTDRYNCNHLSQFSCDIRITKIVKVKIACKILPDSLINGSCQEGTDLS